MTESFAELFEQSLSSIELRSGTLVNATVIEVRPDYVLLDAGLKTEGVVPTSEFDDENPQVGDDIEVVVKNPVNALGETHLSREDARRSREWEMLEAAAKEDTAVTGVIVERVKGGFIVAFDSVRAFLPGSLLDVKPVRDPSYLENKDLEFKVIKIDRKRNNIVVSRRAMLQAENSAERDERLAQLQEGQEMIGIVKNVTDYGAFIDLGGIDGLLHITDMAWSRVRHPREMLTVGEECRVKILKFDQAKNRISLGVKQLKEDPWLNIERRYPKNSRLFGTVTNLTDYGCFVQLEEGIEGLVHMSEMDWTNKNIHPTKIVQPGEEVEVMVLEINEKRRRVSLGLKQCRENPWRDFYEKHQQGETVKGKITSITDFGLFIGLEGHIDGLVHLSDISWSESGERAIRKYKKGDEVEAIILSMDPERERVSLCIKQLKEDPLPDFLQKHKQDKTIKALVKSVDHKQATLEISKDLYGQLYIGDYSYERIKNLKDVLNEGDEVEVMVISIDQKNRHIQLSRKMLEQPIISGEKGRYLTSGATSTKITLGDLLKEQMEDKKKEN